MPVSSPIVLVFDLGLTNCKSIAFSLTGQVLGRATISYPSYYPQPGWVEQDPDEWWQAVCRGAYKLWEQKPDLASQVAAISVTGHMHALVAVGADGRTLPKALVLGDGRSQEAALEVTRSLGLPTIYQITGARMDASMPAAKIRWLRSEAHHLHHRTQLYTGCKDYIRSLLTGDRFTDPIDACALSLYDLEKRDWSPDMMQAVGAEPNQLPDLANSTDFAGPLLEMPAQALGLKPGIPVVVGGGDDIEVLGCGLMQAGQSLEHLGTTGSILTCTDQPVLDPEMALELYPHADPNLWVLGGSITSAGSALAWTSELMGYPSLESAFAVLAQDAPAEADNLVFLPHIAGERCPAWQPNARGSWLGLNPTQIPDHLMRASFEGVVFALRSILDRIQYLAGPQSYLAVSARLDEDMNWLKLRANAYEIPLRLIRTVDPTALGAMILAAVGIGVYPDLETAVKATLTADEVLPPDPSKSYRRKYDRYQRAQRVIASFWEMDE